MLEFWLKIFEPIVFRFKSFRQWVSKRADKLNQLETEQSMWFGIAQTKHLMSMSDRHLCHDLHKEGHSPHSDTPSLKNHHFGLFQTIESQGGRRICPGRQDELIKKESIKRNKNYFSIPKRFKMRNWSYMEKEE